MTYDLIAIGESLRDVFYTLDEKNHSSFLDTERNLLCLEYAEKIPVKRVIKVPAAGNSSNAAVGSSRLGLKSALITWVGQDVAGDDALEALKKDRVDTRFVAVDKNIPTSEATILNYDGERTQLVYFQPRNYVLPSLPTTKCIYYSAMGGKHAGVDRALLKELRANPKIFFVFQPGTTHILAGLDKILPLIARSDLFILNLDETHQLLPDGDRTVLSLLESFHHIGAKTVIITDGKNGADCLADGNHYHMPIFPSPVLEKTGAGDSFATAVTVALLKKESIQDALRWGAANSASVVGQIGPQRGLLTKNVMAKNLKKFNRLKAQLIKH